MGWKIVDHYRNTRLKSEALKKKDFSMEKNQKIIGYYRVSTAGQGRSGLGLEAQKKQVADYVAGRECAIIAEYTEVESGRNDSRIELGKAIEHCKKENATLVIAKLDRLSRSVSFLFALKESGVNFCACNFPQLNTLTLAIIAGVAQHEAELISSRTKAALQAKKKAGFQLGSPKNLTREAREKGVDMLRRKARTNNESIFMAASDLRKQGMSYAKIATRLGGYGIKGTKGGNLSSSSVWRILNRYGN